MQGMENKKTLLHCPPDALYDFAKLALEKFAPESLQYISYRELLEFIDKWVQENFDEV